MALLSDLHIDSDWTLFLDRDGVINKKRDNDYVKSTNEFEFLPGSLEAMALLAKAFRTIVVVTNQQGIGKGLMSEAELSEVHNGMLEQIRTHGGRIDAVYFAPWLKEQNHPERKPGTGMAEKAQRDFPSIDFHKSVMAGDSLSDIEFGKKAGMKTVFIGTAVAAIADRTPDFVFPSLLSFANALVETNTR